MLPPEAIAVDNGAVLALITLLTLPIAATAFARSGGAWRRIGRGPFAIEREEPPPPPTQGAPPVDRALQETEARQMLEAKSYRHQRRGEPPLDVEAEVARLLDSTAEPPSGSSPEPGADPELRSEVRRLVIARNERRLRQGKAPLDVEAETERQLADLVGSS